MLFFGYLPPFGTVTELGMKVLGIFIGAIWCFSTVGCFWPALLALILFGTSGLYEGEWAYDQLVDMRFVEELSAQ